MAVRLRVGDGGQPGLARAGEWDARAVEQVLSRQQLQVREIKLNQLEKLEAARSAYLWLP